MGKRYIAFVEADAGIAVEAESKEAAREMLEQANTGVLGPAKVRGLERDDDGDEE